VTVYFLLGDLLGLAAHLLIVVAGVLMLFRKMLVRRIRNLDLLRKIHIGASTGGGVLLVLHAAYFATYPLTAPVILGYVAAAAAVVVWLTGTAFLERFRDSLFFHGSLSLVAISAMSIHAFSAGVNLPVFISEVGIAMVVSIALLRAAIHVNRIIPEGRPA